MSFGYYFSTSWLSGDMPPNWPAVRFNSVFCNHVRGVKHELKIDGLQLDNLHISLMIFRGPLEYYV